jgi:hypothetical protein
MIFILKKYRYGFSGNYKIEDDFTLIRFQNDGIENFNVNVKAVAWFNFILD